MRLAMLRSCGSRCILLVSALSLTIVTAQESRATLSGTVIDPSGSSISGAKLTLVSVDTSTAFTAEASQAGQYRFLFLNPGKYRLTAEMTGFRTLVREGIELSTNQAATLDIRMQL